MGDRALSSALIPDNMQFNAYSIEKKALIAVVESQVHAAMNKPPFIGKRSAAAGGWGALKSVGKQLLQSGAPLAGAKALLKANQPDGFDCPGCAWGDPEHGSSFEFCENGVKAVAWEATEKRNTPVFFAQHTVTELRGWSDYDLEHQGRLTQPLRYDPQSDRYLAVDWAQAFKEI